VLHFSKYEIVLATFGAQWPFLLADFADIELIRFLSWQTLQILSEMDFSVGTFRR
jgi:hypothetical protein